MSDQKKKKPQEVAGSVLHEEIHNEDFQFVLKALLAAYQPILEEELRRAKAPEELKKEVEGKPPSCEDELALANRIFEKFFTEEVAVRALPAEGRKLLGPIDRWRWCLFHIRCCIVFGWLICRRPRTFRAFVYYMYQYWVCIRRSLGTPVATPPTEEQRQDFRTLVEALAAAYKPYLTDQLASVDFPVGIPEEVLAGKITCFEGQEELCAIFERLLTVNSAQALLGKEAFATHSKEPNFWFCRCWCLCAICFGCCLARADSFTDVVRCLLDFFRCLRDCFRPLVCELTDPQGCVAEEINVALKQLVVAVKGSAGGVGFNHYILEWSSDGINYHANDFDYPPIPPGGGTQGNTPVFGGLLAYFDTTLHDEGLYFIRMTVYAVDGTSHPCSIQFNLFKKDVRILGVDDYLTLDTSEFDPAARFVENVPALCARPAAPYEVSFGECISIQGSAFVGGCENQKISTYTLDYKPGFETNPNTPGWTNFWSVTYTTPAQYRDMNMRRDTSELTSIWVDDCVIPNPFPPPFCLLNLPQARLAPSCWQTHFSPPCGLSGLITLRLTVQDTLANVYYDTQRVWIDNKPICATIRIDAVPKCADLFVSTFANPPDCSVPWAVPLAGIAYDEYIDELLPLTRPNDNFDYYIVKVEKQGGPEIQIPIPGPGIPDPLHPCFYGTSRVGDPGTRCVPCDPTSLGAVFGTLAQFDLRAVDPICKPSLPYSVPDQFTIPRGQCCVYVFKVWVYDRTIFPGGPHWAYADWPVKICNDLK